MIAKPFWLSVVGAMSVLLSACVNSPAPQNTVDAQPTPSAPQAPPASTIEPVPLESSPESAATPTPVEPAPPPQAIDLEEPLIEAEAGRVPFQDIEPAFKSAQQARDYQDSLYRLLVGEMKIAKGDYQNSAEHFLQVAKLTRQADIAERATRIALFGKDMKKVEQAARLWLELAPQRLEARQVLVVALLRLDKSAEAAQHIEAILDSQGSSIGSSSETLVGLLKQSGNHTTALQVIDELSKRRSQDTHLLYLHARLLIGAEQIAPAIEQLEKLLALQPAHEDAVSLYVRLLHQQGETQKVLDFLRQQLALFPERDDWRLTYARLLISADQADAAQAQFEQLLAQKPDDSELLYTLGLLGLQNEQPTTAQRYFQQLLDSTDEADQRNRARYFLGQAAEQAEQTVEALNWYRQVDDGQYYFNANMRIVLLHLEDKNFAQALTDFKDIVPATPDEEFKLLQLEAEIYMQQKQFNKAFAVYQSGLERDPENIDLLYMQGMVAEKIDRLDILEANFRRILELEPGNVDTLNALGYTLADRTHRYQEALSLIQQAYEKRPHAHYILDSMGWVMYRLRRYEEAIDYLRQALAAQEDPEIAAHLGEVLWQSGQQDEARALWEAMKAKYPDDEVLQKTLQKFLSDKN